MCRRLSGGPWILRDRKRSRDCGCDGYRDVMAHGFPRIRHGYARNFAPCGAVLPQIAQICTDFVLRLAAQFCRRLREFAQIFMRLAALVLLHRAVKKSVKTRVQSVEIRVEWHHSAHRAVKKSVKTRVQSVRIRVESHHGTHHAGQNRKS